MGFKALIEKRNKDNQLIEVEVPFLDGEVVYVKKMTLATQRKILGNHKNINNLTLKDNLDIMIYLVIESIFDKDGKPVFKKGDFDWICENLSQDEVKFFIDHIQVDGVEEAKKN